jgi:hypothetical protein
MGARVVTVNEVLGGRAHGPARTRPVDRLIRLRRTATWAAVLLRLARRVSTCLITRPWRPVLVASAWHHSVPGWLPCAIMVNSYGCPYARSADVMVAVLRRCGESGVDRVVAVAWPAAVRLSPIGMGHADGVVTVRE